MSEKDSGGRTLAETQWIASSLGGGAPVAGRRGHSEGRNSESRALVVRERLRQRERGRELESKPARAHMHSSVSAPL